MAIEFGKKRTEEVGSWQQYFVPSSTERIQKARVRTLREMEICLERARAHMEAQEKYKDEPRVIQRARIFETYLKQKTVYILDDELIVGNITSKIRGGPFFDIATRFVAAELDDPVRDFEIRPHDKFIITPDERKELHEVLIPYFNGKTLGDRILETTPDEIKDKSFSSTAVCSHMSVIADLSIDKDMGHQMANYEKVLHKGLNGIRKEVEWYLEQLEQPYSYYEIEKKRDFYKAALISIDASIAYSERYAELASQIAAKENNPKRRKELERIAEICHRVPANPARDFWEAIQSIWMIHCLIHCELYNEANSLGRLDQYLLHYYEKSVVKEKTINRNDALELLECLWIKMNEWAMLLSYDVATFQPGQGLSQCVTIGGQTREGKDACNEVTMLCLEAEKEVGLHQPELAMRIWEETPAKYLKAATEVIRLGRGKPKFIGDRKGIRMAAGMYPDLKIGDWRNFVVMGCTELCLPQITMQHSWEGICVTSKVFELALNNGKCAICGKQVGPTTGDPKNFGSMSALREAYQKHLAYCMEYMAKGIKIIKEAQATWMYDPFCSTLAEGPLQKGRDLAEGGAWYNVFGLYLAGLADTADSFAIIDKLIFHEKKITWEQLLDAIRANWKGFENLRQLCINGVPKYGNDNDFADDWATWVMDSWYDIVDWLNSRKDLIPSYGGKYIGAGIIGQTNVTFGPWVAALPNGHIHPEPIADCISPSQGVDKNGPTAVIKSVSKLPTHRFVQGGLLNLRLNPQLVATDRDLDNFASFVRTAEELGLYHVQFNVVSSEQLHRAMKEPEKFKDLLVRVASYCAYFVELTKEQQVDIIKRTEQQGW
jgi:pyruvate formate-lyase/glycerol dehydratase family glycyl radical enzyme